jgi:hypothetical protein
MTHTTEEFVRRELRSILRGDTGARFGADLIVEDLAVRELKNVDTPMRLFRLR